MKAVVKIPGCSPYLIEIDNTLESLQKAVGGYIEAVTVDRNAAIICNEEGLINGMHYCITIRGIQFFGPILIVGVDEDEFCDVPNENFWLNELDKKENTL